MPLRERRREIVLGAILVVVLFWLLRPAAPPEAAAADPAVAQAVDPLAPLRAIPDVDLTKLASQQGEYEGGGRNLFDYGVKRPPPPSPEEQARMAAEAEALRVAAEEAAREAEKRRQEALAAAQEEAERRAREQAEEARRNPPPPPAPVPPAVDVRLIGLVGDPGDKIAIFADGEGFVLARRGDTVKGAFRVEEIGYDTLTLGFTDPQFQSERRVLNLGE